MRRLTLEQVEQKNLRTISGLPPAKVFTSDQRLEAFKRAVSAP